MDVSSASKFIVKVHKIDICKRYPIVNIALQWFWRTGGWGFYFAPEVFLRTEYYLVIILSMLRRHH